MKIHRLWVNNNLRNYHYIVENESTKEAVVFDPFDVDLIMQCVKDNDLNVTTIINTHEHADHIQGNGPLKAQTGAKIIAPDFAIFSDADEKVKAGQSIDIDDELRFQVYFTPGHTLHHFSYLLNDKDKSYLFAGDTIFNAGAGHVYSGDAVTLYQTFANVLPSFDKETLIYNGHDLFEGNLNFALSLEPSNEKTKDKLAQIKAQQPEDRHVASFAEEYEYNPFLRLKNKEIQQSLIDKGYLAETDADDEQAVFVALRAARDNW